MNEIIFLVNEPPEGGYAAEALGHAIFTVAGSLDELNLMVRDAVDYSRGRPASCECAHAQGAPRGDSAVDLKEVGQHFGMRADDVAAALFS